MRESIDERPARSSYNPEALPERTLREVKLFELGSVTFPAYAGATAGLS
jgi:phage head maturation protease